MLSLSRLPISRLGRVPVRFLSGSHPDFETVNKTPSDASKEKVKNLIGQHVSENSIMLVSVLFSLLLLLLLLLGGCFLGHFPESVRSTLPISARDACSHPQLSTPATSST